MDANKKIHYYTDNDIEISWNARRCIHAGECVNRLPAVFDTTRRPWILPDAASANDIANVISNCPSGALHFKRRDGGPSETPNVPPTIVPTPGGPLYVRGSVRLQSADGLSIVEDVRMALCRCGQSGNKPFCDN